MENTEQEAILNLEAQNATTAQLAWEQEVADCQKNVCVQEPDDQSEVPDLKMTKSQIHAEAGPYYPPFKYEIDIDISGDDPSAPAEEEYKDMPHYPQGGRDARERLGAY